MEFNEQLPKIRTLLLTLEQSMKAPISHHEEEYRKHLTIIENDDNGSLSFSYGEYQFLIKGYRTLALKRILFKTYELKEVNPEENAYVLIPEFNIFSDQQTNLFFEKDFTYYKSDGSVAGTVKIFDYFHKEYVLYLWYYLIERERKFLKNLSNI